MEPLRFPTITVVFRVDASIAMGTGHLQRCVTLAKALKNRAATIFFVCAHLTQELQTWLTDQHIQLLEISPNSVTEDAGQTLQALSALAIPIDWLIVDHYGLDAEWERNVATVVKNLLVIDDLANRPHQCQVLLDQNYYHNAAQRYQEWVPANCQQLLGPQYALLRPEFAAFRQEREWKKPQYRGLIFYGGTDPSNETEKALQAVRLLNRENIHFDVVVGGSNPNKEHIQTLCAESEYLHFHCQISHMAELMSQADFSLGAGGVTTWERCCVGLPSIVTIIADNQTELTHHVAEYGAIWNAGEAARVSAAHLSAMLGQLIDSPDSRRAMSEAGMRLLDGQGLERIVANLDDIPCREGSKVTTVFSAEL